MANDVSNAQGQSKGSNMTATARVFIDGEAGTTGLGIATRLEATPGLKLIRLDDAHRKDPSARRAAMEAADVVVLCLPDAAARESVALAQSLGGDSPKILDSSTAHRVAPGWVYGFPELLPGQAQRIAEARYVANPGCYPTGAIALLRPLVDALLLPRDYPVSINAVSGYSGGGKALIAAHEQHGGPPFTLYGLALEHKHVPETFEYSGLARRPIFVPSVGHFRQGMLVSIPLHLDMLNQGPSGADLHDVLAARYQGSEFVKVVAADPAADLEPEALNGTNKLELRVYANEAHGQAVLVARLDNLGKGASGAAVQNLRLMLGLEASAQSELAHAG
jgi:N-acetyl-gamma-glutamyl-phosphate reductase